MSSSPLPSFFFPSFLSISHAKISNARQLCSPFSQKPCQRKTYSHSEAPWRQLVHFFCCSLHLRYCFHRVFEMHEHTLTNRKVNTVIFYRQFIRTANSEIKGIIGHAELSAIFLAASISLASKSMPIVLPCGLNSARFRPKKPSPQPISKIVESCRNLKSGTRTFFQ
jgi:hypothetical protein